jgi:hypothetical protein
MALAVQSCRGTLGGLPYEPACFCYEVSEKAQMSKVWASFIKNLINKAGDPWGTASLGYRLYLCTCGRWV